MRDVPRDGTTSVVAAAVAILEQQHVGGGHLGVATRTTSDLNFSRPTGSDNATTAGSISLKQRRSPTEPPKPAKNSGSSGWSDGVDGRGRFQSLPRDHPPRRATVATTTNVDRNFEEAVDDFLRAADEVQNAGKRGQQGVVPHYLLDLGSDDSSDSSERDRAEGNLETISEEGRSLCSATGGGDSSSPEDDSTVKENEPWSATSSSNRESTSDLSSCSSDRPKSLRDSSTCCNDDFQWIRREPDQQRAPVVRMEETAPQNKPPISRREKTPRRSSSEKSAPGSLDRRRHPPHSRHERDQKSRSTHIPKEYKSPPRYEDYSPQGSCRSWCCSSPRPEPPSPCTESFHRRHERADPQRYGSSSALLPPRCGSGGGGGGGSHPDLFADLDVGRYRLHDPMMMGCCAYHTPPPCCLFGDARAYHWTPPPYTPLSSKGADHEEKIRKLQGDRDNLQLQVQVLSEQIEAQSDKISDLEKSLTDKKQQLISTEDLLQREMLSRSSLETQKLELMSAMSEMKLQQAALERENVELRSTRFNNNNANVGGITKPPVRPRASPQPMHSTPVHHGSNPGLNMRVSPSPSPVPMASLTGNAIRKTDVSSPLSDTPQPKTPPATFRRQIDIHYGSLPRQQFLSNGELVAAAQAAAVAAAAAAATTDSNANPANGSRRGVAFGRGLSSLLGVRSRGRSVPNLAETEKIIIDDVVDGPQSPSIFNKNKGIKKIFGRMKRSGSGNLEDLPGLSEFQRGGVRATASARLGWSEPQITSTPSKPFNEWDTDNVCDWLQDLGLDQYIPEARRWIKNGQQLQEAPIQEIEKELNIKNALHRKKLQLAIFDVQENGSSDPHLCKAGQLDTAWILRWLDDSGLPQHKDAFLTNRIDGRVLHRLTMDDLALLHVTSLLHVASLKRGIQVLRENNFDPSCLQRRSLPDDPERPTPQQISLWTAHRVMEWLRAVDLAEYAPNLRGAGVHGGLMVHEQKFTAELLAALLNIPPGKTLLRRHLNTHFKELLGKDIIQEKREAEATLGYIPLTPSSKLKIAKKSQFSLKRKKSKGEMDYGDLVCPLNPNSTGELNGSGYVGSMGMMKMEDLKEEDVSLVEEGSPASSSYSPSPCISPLPHRLREH